MHVADCGNTCIESTQGTSLLAAIAGCTRQATINRVRHFKLVTLCDERRLQQSKAANPDDKCIHGNYRLHKVIRPENG